MSEPTTPNLPNASLPVVFWLDAVLPSILRMRVSEIRTPCPATYCFLSAFSGSAGAVWAAVAG
jgi:hypothetical protein